MRFKKILNPAFAESFIKIGQKLKNRQPNVLIGLFMHFPFYPNLILILSGLNFIQVLDVNEKKKLIVPKYIFRITSKVIEVELFSIIWIKFGQNQDKLDLDRSFGGNYHFYCCAEIG